METSTNPENTGQKPNEFQEVHVVFGGGGTKAVLSGTGAVFAFHVAGLLNFASIGSASGGSVPAAVLAYNLPPREFLVHLLDADMSKLVVPRVGSAGRMLAILKKYDSERTRPRVGAYSTKRYRRFVSKLIPAWPKKFWTIATCEHGQVLFTADGVYKYAGSPLTGRLISPTPPSVGHAVAATCAMPGILDSVKFRGEVLFDGALSGDGEVPVDVVSRHFTTNRHLTVAIDIGPEPLKQRRWLRFLWNVFCGGTCETNIDAVHPTAREGLILINPKITGFHGLEFKLNRDQKWHAVIAGFTATADAICQNELVSQEYREKLQNLSSRLAEINASAYKINEFSKRVEEFLCANDLFCEAEQ